MGVAADELADFVDEENDPVARSLGVKILLHPSTKIFHRDREFVLCAFDPADARVLALAQGLAQGLDDLVLMDFVGVTLGPPITPSELLEGLLEGLQLSLSIKK